MGKRFKPTPEERSVLRAQLARVQQPAPLLGRVTVLVSPACEGATEVWAPTRDATAPAAPAHVRHVSARDVSFRGPAAGDTAGFRLQEWTTELEDGIASTDYIWVRGTYALIVAVSDGGVVFIRQYKKAAERTLLVLPWGGIDGHESPLDAGRRELEEETGYSFDTAEVHGPFYDLPDKSTGGHWVIVARSAYRKTDLAPADGELIFGIELIPVGQLWQHRLPVLMHVGALRLAGF